MLQNISWINAVCFYFELPINKRILQKNKKIGKQPLFFVCLCIHLIKCFNLSVCMFPNRINKYPPQLTNMFLYILRFYAYLPFPSSDFKRHFMQYSNICI